MLRKPYSHILLIFFLAFGAALPAYAAKDLDIRNDTTSFLYVSSATGNVGVGTTVPLAKLQIGVGPTITAGSDPAAAIKGNLVVDGKIYGDGSLLTGISSSQWTTTGSDVYYNTGNVGIGTSVPANKLEVNGNITLSAAGGKTITTSGNQLVLEQTGDTLGSTKLFLQNRTGANGLVIQDLSGTHELVDLILKTNNGDQKQVRFLNSSMINSQNTDGEILIGANTGTPDLMIGNAVTSVPYGNLGIGTTAPVTKLFVSGAGSVPNAMSITGNDAYIKGNIEFDGKIYGDGSALTGVSSISGLTAGKLPKASSSTTIVDSAIYENGGNVGIGTTAPQATLEVGNATSIVAGSSPAVAVKSNVVVDGNIYSTEYHLGANAVIKYNAGTSSIDFVIN